MITADELRRIAHYDAQTGIFTALVARGKKVFVGKQMGRPGGTKKKYLVSRIHNRIYFCHKLAWLYVHGEWPPLEIDHINCDGQDNRLSNLRLATRSQNAANQKLTTKNKTGLKGVSKGYKGKWHAAIGHGGKTRYLGEYATPEEAHAVWKREAERIFGEFARAA